MHFKYFSGLLLTAWIIGLIVAIGIAVLIAISVFIIRSKLKIPKGTTPLLSASDDRIRFSPNSDEIQLCLEMDQVSIHSEEAGSTTNIEDPPQVNGEKTFKKDYLSH